MGGPLRPSPGEGEALARAERARRRAERLAEVRRQDAGGARARARAFRAAAGRRGAAKAAGLREAWCARNPRPGRGPSSPPAPFQVQGRESGSTPPAIERAAAAPEPPRLLTAGRRRS